MIRIVLRRLAGSCREFVAAPWFNLAGFVVILVNAVALGLETYDPVVSAAGPVLHAVEYACVIGFAVELSIRFGAHLESPGRFFRDRWNLFDLAIVVAPLLPGVRENVTLLRLLRLARIVRTFRLFPSLRVILVGIRRSLPGLASFLLVTVLVLYGYAMLGWMMFGDAYPERYGTVGQAMLTLFLLLSLDGITDALEAGREVTSWAVLYYVSYMVAACYLLTNLLVGLVLTALQEAHDDERDAKLKLGVGSPEHSVREQLAQMRALIDALERQLPPARGVPGPARPLPTPAPTPTPVPVGGGGAAERAGSREAAPRELP
ncbi:ion transporter [Cryptosporangium japonicum]|uniref:Ion transport domain-containing protein n=1 Tax=Cryptosporangium japonicum TaxID=80872 RepID=A0ABP3EJJ9_9ACTN